MKKYIFLTNTIDSIGGSQLYISRKVNYLKMHNWDVEVYYTDYGEVLIENLKPFVTNHLQVLCVPIDCVSRKEREKLLNHFTPNEITIIETHLVHLSVWGEYIAKHIGGKHLAYFLCEHFPPLSDSARAFLRFKLHQKLLYGITNKSIPALFREDFDGSLYKLLAVGAFSAVGDNDERITAIPNADYTILSLGRLDKPYIPFMIASVKDFSEKYNLSKINLIVIGDSQYRDTLFAPLNSIHNIHVFQLGNMSPIPQNVFTISDVAIATAGCVVVTSRNDVPTIVVDGNDYSAIGVMGYTTRNSLFRDVDEPPIQIKSLLEDILIKKMYSKKGVRDFETPIDYSAHQRVIDQDFDGEYYDVENDYRINRSSIEYIVARFFGWRVYLQYMHTKYVIKKVLKSVLD